MTVGVPEQPTETTVNGRRWQLYGVDYETPDGKFSFYIYALSWEHAEMLVTEIRETATLYGKVEGVVQ